MRWEVRPSLSDSNPCPWRRVLGRSSQLGHEAGGPVVFHRFLGRINRHAGARVVSDFHVVFFELAPLGGGALVKAVGAVSSTTVAD